MTKPSDSEAQTPAVITPTSPTVLPPVPGGGSWRPNAAGDGWLENPPTPSTPEIETATNTNTPE